ncbi:hypothetical protein RJ639_003637 [Escallonia herrerae]|uniref:Disease resistance protein n=1 Tax=Escallonia herrerae TaxID=1293975 RepID=A0AA88W4F9_9ASTE|nr:hypothetical protein RJ639_003637 [Escallonia herrerae]
MEILASALAGAVVELGKCFCGCAYSKIENFAKFRSNLDNLRGEMDSLIILRNSVKEIIAEAKRDGHELLNPALVEWLEQVEQLDTEVGSFIVACTTNNNGETLIKYCPSCCFSCKPGLEVTRKLKDVKQLIVQGSLLRQKADAELKLGKQEVPKGQSIPGLSVPSKSLDSVLKSLNREDVNRIGVWGMGGVGKTTLVRTLNNTPSFMQPFSMVIWVTVSKQFDMRRVQMDIAKRLNMHTSMEESMELTARRIFQRLQLEEKLLLILDDVWEAVDLDRLGVPEPDDCPGWKLLLTSRSLDVCRQMKTDEDIKVEVLDHEESWKLFNQNAGKVVNLENIEQVAKQVAKECGGLPLLLNIVGASMRGKEMVQQWENALSEMQRSRVPNINGIHNKFYNPLKWSYDALEGTTIKSCFRFCALYPEDFSIDVKELVQSWLAEGLIDELRSYEESMNRGIALIENLKDSCLLERGDFDAGVKMHDVVRDLASWISTSSSSEDGCRAFVRSGLGLTNFPEVETPDSVKRVSFMHNRTRELPQSVVQCPEVSTLLLQGNRLLRIVPEGFLTAFKSLKVLNLNESRIKILPQSLLQLRELRALLLRKCVDLEELPPLGGFTKLQVLDCYQASAIKKLPQGMEQLINLRALDISHTYALRHIQPGIFSKLSSLEFLDMSWGANWEQTQLRPTQFELECLKRLTALYIHLDISRLASGSFEWIERLKRFNFLIGHPSNTNYYFYGSEYTKKRVTVFTLCLSGKYFGWLLNNVSTLTFDNCQELEKFPESLGRNVCYSTLRSLTIGNYNGQFRSSNAGFCQIPNLELLIVRRVHHLESISQLASTLGLEFSKLRTIEVVFCEKLKYLFSVEGSTSALEHLVRITLIQCEELEELFAYGSSSANPFPHPIVLNMRRVDLHDLPKLEYLSRENEPWNCLEELKVLGCEKVRKLPLTAESQGIRIRYSQAPRVEAKVASGLLQLYSPSATFTLDQVSMLYFACYVWRLIAKAQASSQKASSLKENFLFDTNASRKTPGLTPSGVKHDVVKAVQAVLLHPTMSEESALNPMVPSIHEDDEEDTLSGGSVPTSPTKSPEFKIASLNFVSSNSTFCGTMPVMVTHAQTLEEQVASLAKVFELLTRSIQDRDSQIAIILSKLEGKEDAETSNANEDKNKKVPKGEDSNKKTKPENAFQLTSEGSIPIDQLREFIMGTIKDKFERPTKSPLLMPNYILKRSSSKDAYRLLDAKVPTI